MDDKKLGALLGVIMFSSIIVMFVVRYTVGWNRSWVIPMVGVLICMICNFLFKQD